MQDMIDSLDGLIDGENDDLALTLKPIRAFLVDLQANLGTLSKAIFIANATSQLDVLGARQDQDKGVEIDARDTINELERFEDMLLDHGIMKIDTSEIF